MILETRGSEETILLQEDNPIPHTPPLIGSSRVLTVGHIRGPGLPVEIQ